MLPRRDVLRSVSFPPANRRLQSLATLKQQMLEQQLAQVKAELEAKVRFSAWFGLFVQEG